MNNLIERMEEADVCNIKKMVMETYKTYLEARESFFAKFFVCDGCDYNCVDNTEEKRFGGDNENDN